MKKKIILLAMLGMLFSAGVIWGKSVRRITIENLELNMRDIEVILFCVCSTDYKKEIAVIPGAKKIKLGMVEVMQITKKIKFNTSETFELIGRFCYMIWYVSGEEDKNYFDSVTKKNWKNIKIIGQAYFDLDTGDAHYGGQVAGGKEERDFLISATTKNLHRDSVQKKIDVPLVKRKEFRRWVHGTVEKDVKNLTLNGKKLK